MTDEFEIWEKGQGSIDVEDYITIYTAGQIAIPSGLSSEHFDNIEYATLLYNKQMEKFAISPITNKEVEKMDEDEEKKIYTISKSGTSTISCTSFLDSLEIVPEEKATKYNANWNEEKDRLEVDISEPVE